MSWDVNDFDAITSDLTNDNELAYSSTISMLETLIRSANISPEEEKTFVGLDKLTQKEAEELIEYLKNNQIDKVESGFGYSQTEIIYKLKSIL